MVNELETAFPGTPGLLISNGAVGPLAGEVTVKVYMPATSMAARPPEYFPMPPLMKTTKFCSATPPGPFGKAGYVGVTSTPGPLAVIKHSPVYDVSILGVPRTWRPELTTSTVNEVRSCPAIALPG